MLKRLFSIITISLVLTGSFFSAYNIKYPVYADSTTDEWMDVTTNAQLVEAFKYYCKSRDLTIEGSVADAVTSFTTKTFNGICNTLGIDITVLQAQIKYQTDSNTGLKFLFSATGVDAYNRIFAQFLQDNDLEVGDENVDKTVESGRWFTDADGYGCWAYISSSNYSGSSFGTSDNTLSVVGTTYRYTLPQLKGFVNQSITFNFTSNHTSVLSIREQSTNYFQYSITNSTLENTSWKFFTLASDLHDWRLGVCYTPNGKLYFGYDPRYNYTSYHNFYPLTEITNGVATSTNVSIVSTVINNNTYEGDTIININGTPSNPSTPDPEPEIPDPNPNPTPDPPTIPDSGGWQDFSLPEMPNDWLIYGMEKKFPFDIPFNIMFALSLLNHEPQIPKFEGDIDLQVCTWHYDIDLTPFDDLATILRKFEVLAFIIGLAILTKNLINWG